MSVVETLVALGANMVSPVGAPAVTLQHALTTLGERGAEIRHISRFYRTSAFPAGSGPDFVNAAVRIYTPWSAGETLEILHDIEDSMGRTRVRRWDARTLDLDLLAVGQQVLPDAATHRGWRDLSQIQQQRDAPDRLILPHPRMQDRAFVLVPLNDVAPNWVHPLLGRSVRQMMDALPQSDRSSVTALE